ncbi:unnamed protein product [Meganyctiphanes norvegica]|uniref:RING-type domain-containing protein n=1 Tax=Meganyctiphanes norvegica TaxID=48144 RepID=A0AAV2STS6_MEGNR
MDWLECKICHVPYDEEEHRPRNAQCGHDICTACVRAIIKDSIFECPKCRQKNKLETADDLLINFGLVDVVRAFKTKNPALTKEIGPNISGATNDEVCKVHKKAIRHRCLKCPMWICDDCIDSHSTLMGCSVIRSSKAVNIMKDEHTQNVNMLVTMFNDDVSFISSKIQEHSDKRKEHMESAKKHGEEEEKLRNLLEQGNIQKELMVESKDQLIATSSPYAVMDRIEVLAQRKQLLRSWSVYNIGTNTINGLLKALKERKDVYVELNVNDKKLHATLLEHHRNICFHPFSSQTVKEASISIPFDGLQKMIPKEPSLVFLELTLGSVVKGRILVRLNENLQKIRKSIVQIVTGQKGSSLIGVKLTGHRSHDIYTHSLLLQGIPVTPDKRLISTAKKGDVLGAFGDGYLSQIYLYVDTTPSTSDYTRYRHIFGNIEAGLDILMECYNKHGNGVKITDCGFVIEIK